MNDWLAIPAPRLSEGDDDWLMWLDERLRSSSIQAGLDTVYPGFLTAHAGQWAKGGDAKNFGREIYEYQAFGGCIRAKVSREDPFDQKTIGALSVMAGKCIRVTVVGVKPGEQAHLMLSATTEPKENVDHFQLGLVNTTDGTSFNCARRAKNLNEGAKDCLRGFINDSQKGQRIWRAHSLEIAPATQVGAGSHAVEVTFMLAYVPKYASEKDYDRFDKNEIAAQVDINLNFDSMSLNGEPVDSGGTDGKQNTVRKRSVAALGAQSLETDGRIAPHTGYVSSGPLEGGAISAMMSQAATLSKTVQQQSLGAWGGLSGEFAHDLFRIGEAELTPQSPPNAIPYDSVKVIREFSVAVAEPLAPGATGSFEAHLSGGTTDNTVFYFSETPAKLVVEENSHHVFKANVSGEVCEVPALSLQTGQLNCQNKVQIDGSITRGLAYLYRDESVFVNENTPGTISFNNARRSALMNVIGATGGAMSPGGVTPGTLITGSQSSEVGIACSCGCEAPRNSACFAQCSPQWATCQ